VVSDRGEVLATYDYYPFGGLRIGGEDRNSKKGFIGKELDETNLNYVEARYLNATIGKFGQIDPVVINERLYTIVGDPQGLNNYAYSRNNPITLVDKDGQKEKLFDEFVDVLNKTKDVLVNGYNSYKAYVSKQNEERANQYATNFNKLSEREKKLYNNAEDYGRAMVKMDEMRGVVMGLMGGAKLPDQASLQIGKEYYAKIGGQVNKGLLTNVQNTIGKLDKEKAIEKAEKAIVSFYKNIGNHINEVNIIKSIGGYTSKVESEIRVFSDSIKTLEKFISNLKK